MKKLIMAVATALALWGCQEPKDVIVAPPTSDKISVTPKTGDVAAEGGVAKVLVSSSAEWTMTSKADYSSWVVASKESGVDGDIVEFNVSENTTDKKLVAEYTFKCGKAEETYVLTSLPKEVVPDHLNLVSPANVIVDYNEGRYELIVESSIFYRQLTATLSEGAADWLTYRVTLEGEKEGEAKFAFDYAALTALEDRTATITISGEGVDPVSVTLTQEAQHRLEAVKDKISAKPAGEIIEVELITNVAYKVEVAAEGKDWIEYKGLENGKEKFDVKAGTTKRSADIVFTQTDAAEGETPLTAIVRVTQQETLVSWAADMNENRLFPKWESTTIEKLGYAEKVTLECLFKANEFKHDISTLMGIEGKFLLRFGDSAKKNQLQLATRSGNYAVPFYFETDTWYHVACTYSLESDYYAYVKIYVNGELKGETQFYYPSVDFTPDWSYEAYGDRAFWMGYSYDPNRSLNGYMTEIRIWKKVLTAEDLKAADHFYTVDPKSEGLYSYWKFTKGEGTSIEDATGNGNALYGETGVRTQDGTNKGDNGIKFVEVALPEE